MRKILYMVGLSLVLLLNACGDIDEKNDREVTSNKEVDSNEQDVVEEEEQEEGIEVDKGLLSVEVTLPASFFEDEDIEEVIEEAKADGVSKVTKNEDGSLTYTMSKSKHKEMLSEMKEEISKYVEELENDDDFPSIKEIAYKKNFREFTLKVEKEVFENSFDAFATLGIGFMGMYYQVFEGGDLEKNKITIHLQDISTGETFDSVVYPDALEE